MEGEEKKEKKERGQMNCFGEDGLQHASDMVFDRPIAPHASLMGGCFQSGGRGGDGGGVLAS